MISTVSIRLAASLLALAVLAASTTMAADPAAEKRRPDRFALIFNMGYAGDHLPQDPKSFEKLVRAIRAAHFNVVLGKYEPWRARICAKYRVQILVDLLVADHHVYKNTDAARKLCESLRGNPVVYGYHLWSDQIGNQYAGRSRDVANVHEWDPTHAVYVGTYRMSRVNRVEGLDLLGYYDFHWQRGGHWGHLAKASSVATSKKAYFLRYCDPAPGKIGVGNASRVAFTIATSVPFGLKGYTFHYRGTVVNPRTGALDALGNDLQKVNASFAAIGGELMVLGNPTAVYSTPVTKTAKDRPTDAPPAVPAGLAAIPSDSWLRVERGEVLLGLFRDDDRDVIALASHNAYQPQEVVLALDPEVDKVSLFDRDRRRWRRLRVTKGHVGLRVAVSATELLRIER